jgi:hypothetical protein
MPVVRLDSRLAPVQIGSVFPHFGFGCVSLRLAARYSPGVYIKRSCRDEVPYGCITRIANERRDSAPVD